MLLGVLVFVGMLVLILVFVIFWVPQQCVLARVPRIWPAPSDALDPPVQAAASEIMALGFEPVGMWILKTVPEGSAVGKDPLDQHHLCFVLASRDRRTEAAVVLSRTVGTAAVTSLHCAFRSCDAGGRMCGNQPADPTP